MKPLLAVCASLLLSPTLGLAATPAAPPAAQPRTYEPPQAQVQEEASCLAVTVESGKPDADILIRNTCAIRVNFALCVRRSDDAAGAVSKGSLSPSAVYQQDVKFTPKTRTFTHRSTFCAGLTCEVVEPEC